MLDPVTLVIDAINQTQPVIATISQDLGQLTQQLTSISGFYDLLIRQNVQLQRELLASQATLAATNKVLQDGVEIKDPKQAIMALQGPIEEAVQRVRQGSLELVGVTSAELIPLLQIVTGQASQIGASLNEASDLTLDFAASMGTLNIPLFGARQEIVSILTGTIDMNSQLAKSLNITNQQVNLWKAQGVLVEKLRERMKALRDGNALAAQTLEGVTSNIAEIVQLASQKAGARLLQPLLDGLNSLYQMLSANQQNIENFFGSIADFILDIGSQLKGAFDAAYPALQQLAQALGELFGLELQQTADGIAAIARNLALLIKFVTPTVGAIASLVKAFVDFASSDLGKIVIQTGLIIAAAASLVPIAIALASALAGLPAIITAFATGLPALGASLVAIPALFAAWGATLVTLPATLGAITATLPALIAGIRAFAVNAIAALAPLLPLLLPIIALGGAIAITLIVKQTGDLKAVNEELDQISKQANQATNDAGQIIMPMKELNELKIKNGKLTDEQAKQLSSYKVRAAGVIGSLEMQNKLLLELQPANENQRRAIEAQIESNERLKKSLENLSGGGITLANRNLEVLGNTYEQLQTKVDAALNTVKNPPNDAAFKQATKTLVELTQQQVSLGVTTREQAIARLESLRNDGRVEMEVQQQAQTAITKIRSDATQKEVQLRENQIEELKKQQAEEKFGEAKVASEITRIKGQELELQLKQVRGAIYEEMTLRKKQLETQRSNLADLYAQAQKAGNTMAANQLSAQIQEIDASIERTDQTIDDLRAKATSYSAQISANDATRRQQERLERLKDYDEKQALLEASLARGKVTEEKYNAESFKLTEGRLREELKQLQEQREKLDKNDKRSAEALNAKEAGLVKRMVEAQASYQSAQVAMLERSQQKATDTITLAYDRRLVEIQKLENQHTITHESASKLRSNETSKRLKGELVAQEKTVKELEKLPQFADPIKEAERQHRIQQARIQTAELTKQLLDQELQQQQAAQRIIEEKLNQRVQAVKSAVDAENLKLAEQQNLYEALNKSLLNQVKLLESRKELSNSLSAFYEGELGALSKVTNNEVERKQIAETIAAIKLKSLREQQQIEWDILNANIKQKENALEMEKIKNRQAKLQNVSDIAQSGANLAKTEARTDLTPEQKKLQLQADRLDLQAKIQQGANLQYNDYLLEQQGKINSFEAQSQAANLNRSQQAAYDNARADFANARVNPADRIRDSRILQQEFRTKLTGNFGEGDFASTTRRYGQEVASEAFGTNGPYQQSNFGPAPTGADTNISRQNSLPQMSLPSLPTFEAVLGQFLQNQTVVAKEGNGELLKAIGELQKTMAEVRSPTVTQTNETTNYFQSRDADNGDLAKTVEQQQRNAQYQIWKELERRAS